MVDVPSLPEAIRATLPPLAVAYLAALEAAVAALATENRLLAEQVAVLQAQLGQNSSNSSRPPSSDPPCGAPAPKPMHGQRRAGGQPGHRGHVRVLVPETEVTTVSTTCRPRVASVVGHWRRWRRRTTRPTNAIRWWTSRR